MLIQHLFSYALLSVLLLIVSYSSSAQILTQTIRGVVQDEVSQQPLVGASVYLAGTDPVIGTITNEAGQFLLKNVPVGRYVLKVSSVGYQTHTVPNLTSVILEVAE